MTNPEVVVLVVGDENLSKSSVADNLALQISRSPDLEVTRAGTRILSGSGTSRSWTVVDTTPFLGVEGSLFKNARQWISQNSLRRILYEKLVFVVCVVTSSMAPTEANSSMTDIHRFGWLDSLGVIFKEHKGGMKILVNTKHVCDNELPYMKNRIEYVLSWHGFTTGNNIIYANLDNTLDSTTRTIVDDNNKILQRSRERRGVTMVPFHLEHASDTSKRETFGTSGPERVILFGSFGPWGPERVILFGSAGSGKSTLAEMLTTGKLLPRSEDSDFEFPSILSSHLKGGSGLGGKEKTGTHWEGRGWYVVDTPAFGKPGEENSKPTREEAERRIKKFVRCIEGLYSHFLVVIRKDRVDQLEWKLWKFFELLFGAEVSHHFSIVVSNADSDWIKANLTHLKKTFRGCTSFLAAEFPAVETVDEEWEAELQGVRQESLKVIEEDLAQLARNDAYCHIGEYVQTADSFSRKTINPGSTENSSPKDVRQRAMGMGKSAYSEVSVTMSSLTEILKFENRIALLPN